MAKARSDAWWTKLDDAAQQQAFEMLTHQGLQAGRLALAAKLEIKPPSLSGVSRFYCYARSEESRWRIQKALQDKAYIEKSMTATGDVSALLVKAIGDLTVDATISRDPDRIKSLVESLTSLLSLQYRQKALDLAQQRFQEGAKRDIEKGFAALFDQVKGNAKAEQLILDLQTIVGGDLARTPNPEH